MSDEELKRLRRKKLKDLMKKTSRIKVNELLNKPIIITDSDFDDTINKHPLILVDFWASWCGPCHMIAPIIEELARDYAGKVVFGKLNIDENRNTAMKYQVMSIPTLLLFKNGKLVDRLVGAMPRQKLEPTITRHL